MGLSEVMKSKINKTASKEREKASTEMKRGKEEMGVWVTDGKEQP